MDRDQAILFVLNTRSWLWRKKVIRNINNAYGLRLLEEAHDQANTIYEWSNFFVEIRNSDNNTK